MFFNRLEELKEDSDLRIHFQDACYNPILEGQFLQLENFIKNYKTRLKKNVISKTESLELMKKTNPKFILRNYILFECIAELNEGKKDLFNKILQALENPYEEIFPEFSKKRPSIYDGQSGSSTLSCSS